MSRPPYFLPLVAAVTAPLPIGMFTIPARDARRLVTETQREV